jgi:hypothetical protein
MAREKTARRSVSPQRSSFSRTEAGGRSTTNDAKLCSHAITRQRGITAPETLLRLFLLHVARGYSLLETSVRADQAGLAKISNVGLMKRLRRAEEWLRWLCTELVAENGVRMPSPSDTQTVRLVDGTIVKEPGKTGSQWRILYSLRLPDLYCDYFDLAPAVGSGNGESFARVPVKPQDLMLADAGYCSASSIRSVVRRKGQVVVRINPDNFPMRGSDGKKLDLLSLLQQLKQAHQVGEWDVVLTGTPPVAGGSVRSAKARKRLSGRADAFSGERARSRQRPSPPPGNMPTMLRFSRPPRRCRPPPPWSGIECAGKSSCHSSASRV